jgi:hypothetical protein
MDDMGRMAQIDGIGNANTKAAWALAEKSYIGTYVGYELNGRIYRVPDFIEALRDPKTGEFDTISCRFMVPVVTGKPVEPTQIAK